MYKLVITKDANAELESIFEYIAETLSNPQAAAALADELARVYANLKRSPELYAMCADEGLSARGYRKAPVKGYVLIYNVRKGESVVCVLGVFHNRQGYARLL